MFIWLNKRYSQCCSNGVDHGHDVVVLRHLFVVGRHHGEPEEHEDAHERGPVSPVPLETHKHLLAFELLLGKLEQGHKAVARALRQHTGRYVHVKDSIDEQCVPFNLLFFAQRAFEAHQEWLGIIGYIFKINKLKPTEINIKKKKCEIFED